MAITRIKNNQITDSTITNAKIVPGTIAGGSLSATLNYSGNLNVTGNLSVSGTTTVVDTVNTTIADPLLVLSRNATGSAAVDSGLIIERGDDTNVAFVWDESADEFVIATTTETGATAGDVTISAYANVKVATAKADTISDQAGTASPKIAGLTATRITFGGTDGILTDNSGFTFASDTLTVGNVTATANTVATASGNLTLTGAGGLVTTGSNVTVTASTASTNETTGALVVTGGAGIGGNLFINGAEVDASGNLTVDGTAGITGNLAAGNISTAGVIGATGTITGGNLATGGTADITGNLAAGNISTAGIASVTGNLTAGNIDTTTAVITTANITTLNATTTNSVDLDLSGNLQVDGTADVTGNLAAGNISTAGVIGATGTITGGNLSTGGTASITGNLSAGNISTSGIASVTGNLTAGNIDTTTAIVTTGNITTVNAGTVNVSTLANITATTASTNTTSGALQVAGGIGVAGNINAGGEVNGVDGNFSGDVVVSGNLTVDGTATYVNTTTTTVKDPILVIGGDDDGAAAAADDNKDRGVLFQWHDGANPKSGFFGFDDSTGKFIFVPDATNSSEVISGTAGDVVFGDVAAATSTITGNLAAGNISTGGVASVTGNLSAGNISTAGILSVTGNATTGNLSTTTAVVTTGNITTINATTINGVDVDLTGNIEVDGTADITGNLAAGNISTAGVATVTGNLTAGNISTGGDATITGNASVDFLGVTQSASVGGNLVVTGVITSNTAINATGTITGGNLSTGGTADITGNLTAGNVSTTTAVITTGNITTINATDINSGNISVTTSANIADANITASTASTTTTSGALKVAGGIGVVGNINVGGAKSTFTDSTASTSNSTGVVVLSGGVGVAGNAFIGNLALTTNTIISSNTNGNINLAPNGTGTVVLNSSGLANDTVIKGETDDNLIYVDASADNVGIGTGTPNAQAKLHVVSTDSIILPSGTTAERPDTPASAMFRYNNDLNVLEFYSDQWESLTAAFTVIASETFAGDGSTVDFTLLEAQTTASCIVSINGVLQVPGTAYSVSGTTLTFTEAPGGTDAIEVRKLTTTSTVTNLADDVNGYAALFATTTGIDMYTGASSRTKVITVDNNGQLNLLATTASTSLSTGALVVDGGAAINGNLFIDGNFIPGQNEVHDLGSTSARWNELFLAGSTITLGNVVIKDVGGSIAFFESNGTTPATSTAATIDLLNNASAPSHLEGRVFYDQDNKALAVYNDEADITLQVGQEFWVRVYNNTGSEIANGIPVYITGSNSGFPTVAASDATTLTKAQAIGLTTHAIGNGEFGYVTAHGVVRGLNTNGLTPGARLHVGVSGGYAEAAPTYPNFAHDIGICIVADASAGSIYVNIQQQATEAFRTTGDLRVGNDLTVEGNLTILGSENIVTVNNLEVADSFIYLNSGDTIGSDNTTFTGSGLDDATFTGHFEGTASTHYYVRIDSVGGGTAGVDTFEWSLDNFSTTEATDVDITLAPVALQDGISIDFVATTGHTLNDVWDGVAAPVNVDVGLIGNRNTGATGVGYTHIGLFFDVTDEKFKLFDEYDPEVTGTVDTGDASFELGTLAADLFEGNLASATVTASTSVVISGTAASTSTASGALQVAGGAGIAGNVYVGGAMYGTATSAQYADLAENYVGDAEYAPGTVVEFGGDAEVTVCSHDMCTRVAGVVSTNPAYLMNSELAAEHVVAVAFTGRVPCKVVGTVRKGDMMVSAGNGAARAEADPKVGSIIGKALQDFDGTDGVIEVVVGRF